MAQLLPLAPIGCLPATSTTHGHVYTAGNIRSIWSRHVPDVAGGDVPRNIAFFRPLKAREEFIWLIIFPAFNHLHVHRLFKHVGDRYGF